MSKWVMIVDDDTTVLSSVGQVLSRHGMQVVALKSGGLCLDYIKEHGMPNLFLLDVMMPDMDGFATMMAIRKYETANQLDEVPVIFLTADEDSNTESRGFEAGVVDYIRKPVDPQVLVRRVENALKNEDALRRMSEEAITDNLTGFLNKTATDKSITREIKDRNGCLILLDLDAFKLVNDLYGHTAGDKVLKTFSDDVRKNAGEGSVLGRIGGDEFLIFTDHKDEVEVSRFVEKLNEATKKAAKEILGKDYDIPLGVSAGAVFVPEQTEDYAEAFRLADKALYYVKQNGKHSSFVWRDGISELDSFDEMNLSHLSAILEERNMRNLALSLNKETFIPIYRFVMRYIKRYGKSASNVLFSLTPQPGVMPNMVSDYQLKFGECAQGVLRKSDVVTRPRSNQFLVMLTDVKKGSTDLVVNKILDAWNKDFDGIFDIKYEVEFSDYSEDAFVPGLKIHVACVDDDPITLEAVSTSLMENDILVDKLSSGHELLKYIEDNQPDLILLDVMMPEMDGFATLMKLRAKRHRAMHIPVIFLTADDDEEAEVMGLSMGAMDYIRKPIHSRILTLRVRHLVELSRMQKDLSLEVEKKTAENEHLFFHVVRSLTDAIDAKDTYTNGHSLRVAEYAREIARRYGYTEKKLNDIYMMGMLHDVGKIGVPSAVINKPGRLTDEEFDIIKKHPVIGFHILENIEEMPRMALVARWHHERYSGGGYPDGLAGEDIPEEARIVAVADAYDAMTSKRSYRDALPQEVVRQEIEKGKGTQFDPVFADIMLEMIDSDKDYNMREI